MPFSIIWTVRDTGGTKNSRSTFEVFVPETFNLSDYGEFAAALAPLADALIHGVLISAELGFTADISGLTGNLAADLQSDVEEVADFQFVTADGYPVKMRVPAYDEAHTVVGGDDIDQADPDVAAIISMMENGLSVTGGTIVPCDVDENDIVATSYAREETRSSAKRG